MIADAFPAPKVPFLDADNALDLEQLGAENLTTLVWFPGIETFKNGYIRPNWRGCTALGEAGDNASDGWPIDDTLTPEGLPISFSNALLTSLDQGWVFYSYSAHEVNDPPGPESRRLFFYVGKRPSLTSHLPVPQIRQSHDLALDPDRNSLPGEGVMVSVPPYAAMAKGDKVTLLWRGFDEDDRPRPLNPAWDVQDADVGRPLTRLVARNEVMLLDGGRLELSYRIVYAGGGEDSVSALQTLRIVAPVLTLLPALTIDGHDGGPLDPMRFPDGATLRVALHPQAKVGDILMLYASVSGGSNAFPWVRLDPSTLDSNSLTLHLDQSWLLANNGKNSELTYQYARPGSVLSGEPLRLLIRRPLDLPLPIVDDTSQESGDEPDEGVMKAGDTTAGSRASVPSEAIVGETDTIHLYWGEPGTPGHSVVTTPVSDNWRAFDIPKNAIAQNMGAGVGPRERLKVFYRVVPNGEPPENYQDSKPYFLKIVPFPQDRFPVIQCVLAQGTGGVLSLALVTDSRGAEFKLGGWAYIEENQILNVKIVGKELYLLKDHPVTAAEAGAAHISSWLLKSDLQTQIGVGNTFKVSVTVSFDDGRTHIAFKDSPPLTLRD